MPIRFEPQHHQARLLWSKLKHFYRTQMPYAKPQLAEQVAVCLTETDNGNDQPLIIAALRIRLFKENQQRVQLLTGLATHRDFRHQGLATQLLQFAKPQFSGHSSYLFCTPQLQPLYQKHGYQTIDIETGKITVKHPTGLNIIPTTTTVMPIIKHKFKIYQQTQTDLVVMRFFDLKRVENDVQHEYLNHPTKSTNMN